MGVCLRLVALLVTRLIVADVSFLRVLFYAAYWYVLPFPFIVKARLLENKNLGVVTSVMSLLMGLASRSPANYEVLVPHVIHLLTRLVRRAGFPESWAGVTVREGRQILRV